MFTMENHDVFHKVYIVTVLFLGGGCSGVFYSNRGDTLIYRF